MRNENGREGTFFWNLYARCYDSIYHLMPYRKLLWDVYQALDLKSGMKVLDAGCGTGNFELFISEKNPPPIEIEAIDFSPVMLAQAKRKCKHLNYVNFELGNLNQKLDYLDDNTFDRILCINVLYASRNIQLIFRELLRVLKPGGKILIADPKPDFKMLSLVRDHFSRFKNIWGFSRKISAIIKTFTILSTLGMITASLTILVIDRKGRKGEYHFLREKEILTLLEQSGIQNIKLVPVYANQNWLAQGVKTIS